MLARCLIWRLGEPQPELAMRAFSILTALFALTACGEGHDPTDEATDPLLLPGQVEVGHFRVPCQGEARQLCLQVRAFGEPEFTLFYSEIEGFDFVWGQHAILEVREEALPDPPADGADRRYILEAVVDTEEVRDAFELLLEAGDVEVLSPTELLLVDGTRATCASADLCRVIAGRMDGSQATVRARAGANPSDPLSFFRVM
jgi:hypothetical protein